MHHKLNNLMANKIWASDEPMPSGDKAHGQTAPSGWFREPLVFAAELYGLERGIPEGMQEKTYTVFVLDNEGNTHTFTVQVRRELSARVIKTSTT